MSEVFHKPNLFECATKELSQDGFFTWLLRWADPRNEKNDKELCACAQNFVKYLVRKQGHSDEIEIKNIEADRQWENIDIWAVVNGKFFIVIEDKTFTKQHSDQLRRYQDRARELCVEYNYHKTPVCIYLKTGSESKASLQIVEEQGFSVVLRNDLLEFFEPYRAKVKNEIFSDFIERIASLEAEEKSFESKPVKDWKYAQWIGFYRFLDSRLAIEGWQYVANPSGGFVGAWWNIKDWKDYWVYLQIEQGNLCFKIEVDSPENRSAARDDWHNVLMSKAKSVGMTEIQKPQRLGAGTYMTVAFVEKKDWLGNEDIVIDQEKVVNKLKGYEQFLDGCLQ